MWCHRKRQAMPKAKPHPNQLGFAFDPPGLPSQAAALAGLERQICSAVGAILNSDPRSRFAIAAEMSELLDETVSKEMLDAYASPAREGHKVAMSRFMALVVVTNRHDLMDPLLRSIGAGLLVGEEVHTARIGRLELLIAEAQRELKAVKNKAPLIRGRGEA